MPGANKRGMFGALLPSAAGFNHLLLAAEAICRCAEPVGRAILASKLPGIWRMSAQGAGSLAVDNPNVRL